MSADAQTEIECQAADWLARLGGRPLSREERVDFEDWLHADPAHREAFEEAQAAWNSLGVLRTEPGALRKVVPRPKKGRKTATAAFVLLIALGGARYQLGDPFVLWSADHHTEPGQIATIQLPDGSVAELGPDSAIALDYDDARRGIRLLRGQAFFAALPQAEAGGRPFTVAAEGGQVTALGTKFQVALSGDGADVTAVEHDIAVTRPSEEQPFARVVLTPGHHVHFTESGIGGVGTADLDSELSWRQGVLVFDAVPLRDVVERLNRYRRGRIVIANGDLADRQVSGVFQTNELTDVVDTITAELGARAVSAPPFVTILY